MSDELKMCPFCVGNAESYSVTSVADFDDDKTLQKKFCVDCSNCDCNLTWFETEKEAVEAWNNRAESRELAELKAQNAVLREALSFYSSKSYQSKRLWAKSISEDQGGIANKAISTTPSEALDKQRKKDEVFDMLVEAVIWMSGSKDFSPEGIARGGFIKIVEPAIKAAKELEGE